ncbi:hypothetical protein [Alkaliphilus transvaalensis]|uniref:hypothetical protein n=1 Tax=Alkaliphilus transvaalensis TaxID=114628 RepID=UPI0012EBDF5F|nr:hypothetical protein [Alkaliphilus transvaalensis]
MRKAKFHLFIFTLILLLAITLYSIYQDNKNAKTMESTQPDRVASLLLLHT